MKNMNVECSVDCGRIDKLIVNVDDVIRIVVVIVIDCVSSCFYGGYFADDMTCENGVSFAIANDYGNCCHVVDMLMVFSVIRSIGRAYCSIVAIFPSFVSLCRRTKRRAMRCHHVNSTVDSSDS